MLTLVLVVAVALQQAAVPPDLVTLYLAGVAALTSLLTQVLKWVAKPLATAPDWVKAVVALVVAFASTKLSVLLGAPIPQDLGGFAAVVVNWLLAMGLHAAVKKAAASLPVFNP